MQYNISTFTGKQDNLPKTISVTWQEIIKRAQRPHIRATKDGPLITGTIFAHDIGTRRPRRKKDLANETSIIFGDIDHGATFEQVGSALDQLMCTGLIYTTYSHQTVSKNNPKAEDRMRICIPLVCPIPASQFDLLWLWLQEQMSGMLDPQAKDVSRIVYSPAISEPSAPYQWAELGAGESTLVDWRKIDLESYRPKTPPTPAYDVFTGEAWEELMGQLRERIAAHPTAHQARGKIHCRGVCHEGESDSALFINRDGVVWCSNEGCTIKDILRAFNLPERPEPKIEFERSDRAAECGLVIVADRRQARHYASQMEGAVVAMGRPIAYVGRSAILEIFDHISRLKTAIIPLTRADLADPNTMKGVRRIVAVLKSLSVRAQVFEVEG